MFMHFWNSLIKGSGCRAPQRSEGMRFRLLGQSRRLSSPRTQPSGVRIHTPQGIQIMHTRGTLVRGRKNDISKRSSSILWSGWIRLFSPCFVYIPFFTKKTCCLVDNLFFMFLLSLSVLFPSPKTRCTKHTFICLGVFSKTLDAVLCSHTRTSKV